MHAHSPPQARPLYAFSAGTTLRELLVSTPLWPPDYSDEFDSYAAATGLLSTQLPDPPSAVRLWDSFPAEANAWVDTVAGGEQGGVPVPAFQQAGSASQLQSTYAVDDHIEKTLLSAVEDIHASGAPSLEPVSFTWNGLGTSLVRAL